MQNSSKVLLLMALVAVPGTLVPAPVAASDYIGLWRVDRTGEGVKLDFPDNGFDGACIRFTNGLEEAGEVKVESQIVRHRLDALSFRATGDLNPDNVHVQVTVKGKTVWIGAGLSFNEAVELPLDGWEATFHIAKLEPSADTFTVSFCDMEYVAPEWTVRHTSDCAGFDFDSREDRLSLVADEDWAALGRDMRGGIGIFGMSPAFLAGKGDVYLRSTFPDGTFNVAMASGGKPILEAEEGLSQPVLFNPQSETPLDFVVKVKSPVPGLVSWQARLDWSPPPGSPESGDALAADALADDAGDADAAGSSDAGCPGVDGASADGLAADGSGCPAPRKKDGGCSATTRGAAVPWAPLWLLLAALVAAAARAAAAAASGRREET